MNKLGISIIVILACLFVIALFIVPKLNENQVQGWMEFEKGALEQFSFVRDVHYQGLVPSRLIIIFLVKEQISLKEAEAVFFYARGYLQSKDFVDDLNRYTVQKIGNKYVELSVNIHYVKGDAFQNYFFSSDIRDNFKSWSLESSDGTTGKYD